jgi:hypothetical protein
MLLRLRRKHIIPLVKGSRIVSSVNSIEFRAAQSLLRVTCGSPQTNAAIALQINFELCARLEVASLGTLNVFGSAFLTFYNSSMEVSLECAGEFWL